MVGSYVEQMTNRVFEETTYTEEEYDGTGNRELTLKHFPITSFSKLEKNNAADNTDDWTTINASEYWVDTARGIITKTSSFLDFKNDGDPEMYDDAMFELGKNRYRCTYTAGYATVPGAIQWAVCTIISYVFNTRKMAGIKSESLGDHTIVFEDAVQRNADVLRILKSFRDKPLC